MSQAKNRPQDFVPDDCRGVIVKNKQDLLFLGRENLEGFRAFYQKTAQVHGARISDLQAQINTLSHRTPISLDSRCDDIIAAIYEIKNFDARVACLDYLIDQKAQLATQRRQISAKVGYLTHLMAEAKSKPYFAHLRPQDCFRSRQQVVLLIRDKAVQEVQNRLAWCTVERTANRHVDVVARNDPMFGLFRGERFEVDYKWPGLISMQDYIYFNEHPEYLKLWLLVASYHQETNEVHILRQAFQQPPFTC